MSKTNQHTDIQILAWAGWYPTSYCEQGIFIKKHLELLGQSFNIRTFHIAHKNHPFRWFKKEQSEESFGMVTIYYIPKVFGIKHLSYFIIPVLEARKCKRVSVFHLHSSFPYAVFTYFLRFMSIDRFVATEHWGGFTDASGLYERQSTLMKRLYRKAIKTFDTLTVVSSFLKQVMQTKIGHPDIRVIPNVVNITPQQTPEKVSKNRFRLLSIGNLDDKVKNYSLLLDVIHKVKAVVPDVSLDIYGSGRDEKFLMDRAEALGLLNTDVWFKGYVPNAILAQQYPGYDAFILLSNYETFSIATFEALSYNLPVFISACGGPESFVNANNGVVARTKNAKEIADLLLVFRQQVQQGKYLNVAQTLDYEFYRKETILKLFKKAYGF